MLFFWEKKKQTLFEDLMEYKYSSVDLILLRHT